jgi:small subunit ribosomal protein S16
MLIIRLQRVGRTNDPSFRVIVTDSKNSAKTGKFLEIVGNYDARQSDSQRQPQFKAERIQYWIKNGAQVSETVHNLLVKNKIIDGKTIDVVPIKPVKTEAEVATETPVKAEEKAEEKVEEKALEAEAPVGTEEVVPPAEAEEKVAEEMTPIEAEEMLVTEEASVTETPVVEVAETPTEDIPVA